MTVNILASRTYPAFRQAVIVAELLPPSLMGDYHLAPADVVGSRAGRSERHGPLGYRRHRVDVRRDCADTGHRR